jgi:hypothetical protein
VSNRTSIQALEKKGVVDSLMFRVGEMLEVRKARSFLLSQAVVSSPSSLPAYYSFVRRIYVSMQEGGLALAISTAIARRDLTVTWGFVLPFSLRLRGCRAYGFSGFGMSTAKEYPPLVKFFGLPWLEAEGKSEHVLWIRWNQIDRLRFKERWERALALLDNRGLVKPEVVRMLKNPDQFLDTIAQVEVAYVLLTKGIKIELEARKSGKTPDIFLIDERVCIEVKNLHIDPVLQEQTLSGRAEVVSLKNRLPSAVEEKYGQLPEDYPNILVVIAAADVQFDEFEDFFIGGRETLNIETGERTIGNLDGFFYDERIDGRRIHTKLGAVIMWKDHERKYLMNPNASIPFSDALLNRITS